MPACAKPRPLRALLKAFAPASVPTPQVDLKGVVTAECVDNSTKKVEANKEAKALLEEKFKSGKNR